MQQLNSKLVLSTPDSYYLLEVNQIVYCRESGAETTLFFKNGEQLKVGLPIKRIKDKIRRDTFFYTDDSCLVNVLYVQQLQQIAAGELLLSNGTVLSISSQKKQAVLHFLKNTARIQI